MHDLTFAKEIISAINRMSETLGNGDEIVSVNASLSPLSHVKPETLIETFKTLTKDTPLEGISLKIDTLRLEMKCKNCNTGFTADKPTFLCPNCHSKDIAIEHSKEFQVESIDVQKKGSKTA